MDNLCDRHHVLRQLIAVALLLLPSLALWNSVSGDCFAKGDSPNSTAWKVGISRVVITPEKPMWMSGYASRSKPAQGKVHDLWAKAMLIQDSAGARSLIITLDLVGIDRRVSQAITDRLNRQFGLERDEISLCTSHTHSGPVVGTNLSSMYFYDEKQGQLVEAYASALPEKMAGLVANALKDLEPVVISYGVGEATFAVNRRNNKETAVPKLREQGKLVGPVDHEVPVLLVRNAEQSIKGILFGYACHATVVSLYEWSGDWPGYAQIEIEKDFPGVTAMFVAGCGADQNPIPRRTVELGEKYGRMMADAVKIAAEKDLAPIRGTLKTEYKEISLPFSQRPSKKEVEAELSSSNRYLVGRAKKLLANWDDTKGLSKTYPYPVQTLRLGDLVLVVLGGEVVVDYSIRLKADLGIPHVWVAGYSNDVMAYIPSRRVLFEGGYEGATSMIYYGLPTVWAPELEEMIVKEVDRQVKK